MPLAGADLFVIPGWPAGPGPEPMNTGHSQGAAGRCSWIPGSWAAPAPRNDEDSGYRVVTPAFAGVTTRDFEVFEGIQLSLLELLLTCQPPLQDPAGKVTRGLPILESNGSVDDRGGDAVCLLH